MATFIANVKDVHITENLFQVEATRTFAEAIRLAKAAWASRADAAAITGNPASFSYFMAAYTQTHTTTRTQTQDPGHTRQPKPQHQQNTTQQRGTQQRQQSKSPKCRYALTAR